MIGSSVGAVLGIVHAWSIYARRTGELPERTAKHPIAVRASAAYYALWTLLLWVLFGSYVFYLWVISVVVYTLAGALKACVRLIPSR